MQEIGKYSDSKFFDRDVQEVSKDLLGRVLEHLVDGVWLSVRIIETEAYYGQGQEDRASHASLGYTENRKALFMDPGTIYMYYSRGGDSLNFTCSGNSGNAVLVKSGYPVLSTSNQTQNETMLQKMRQLNPLPNAKNGIRSIDRLCNGQTLLCKSIGLKVKEWDCQNLSSEWFRLDISKENSEPPTEIIQTTRLGIPKGRDENLPYRFIHSEYVTKCTKNPLTMRKPPAVLNRIQTDLIVQSVIKKEESETNAVQDIPEKKNTFFCKTCKITCGSRVELRRHKNSKRHVDGGVTY